MCRTVWEDDISNVIFDQQCKRCHSPPPNHNEIVKQLSLSLSLWGANLFCEKGGQGSKILETQLSSFTKVNKSKQTKREWNWIQPDNYYSFDLSHQCSSNESIRNKHAVLALKSVLVYYCQHLNNGKSRDTKNGGANKLRQRIVL